MKKIILFVIIVFSACALHAQVTPIGGKKTWVEVLGGLKIDSAEVLPKKYALSYISMDSAGRFWYDVPTKSVWYHDGTSRIRIANKNYTDSIFASLSFFPAIVYDTNNLVISASSSVMLVTIPVTAASTYRITGYINQTISNAACNIQYTCTDETSTTATANIKGTLNTQTSGNLVNSFTNTAAQGNIGKYSILGLDVKCAASSMLTFIINDTGGSGSTVNLNLTIQKVK